MNYGGIKDGGEVSDSCAANIDVVERSGSKVFSKLVTGVALAMAGFGGYALATNSIAASEPNTSDLSGVALDAPPMCDFHNNGCTEHRFSIQTMAYGSSRYCLGVHFGNQIDVQLFDCKHNSKYATQGKEHNKIYKSWNYGTDHQIHLNTGYITGMKSGNMANGECITIYGPHPGNLYMKKCEYKNADKKKLQQWKYIEETKQWKSMHYDLCFDIPLNGVHALTLEQTKMATHPCKAHGSDKKNQEFKNT